MLLNIEDARSIIRNRFNERLKFTKLNVLDAIGKVVSHDIISPKDVPEINISSMDGYAFRIKDYEKYGKLKVIGSLYPTTNEIPELEEGCAYYVTTGAPIPKGADAVVRVEASKIVNNYLIVGEEVFSGKDIRIAGDDVKKGEIVIKKGEVITPYHLALLLRLGIREVNVVNYKFCIIAIGDELKPYDKIVNNEDIIDSISPVIVSLLSKFGKTYYEGVISDNESAIVEKLTNLVNSCDIIITIGGSSVGERDFTKKAIRRIGELLFEGVNVNVLKRGSVGVINDVPVISLPGQIVSAVTVFHEHILNLLSRFIGVELRQYFKAKLYEDLYVKHKMDSVYLFSSMGEYVKPLRWGVGLYSVVIKADSFGILKRGINYKRGEEIVVQRLLI
jgi:molybdopterin molybdotransferase